MTYAALRDLFSFTIPNWIPVAVVIGFLLAAVAEGNLWSIAALMHISAGGAVLIAVAILFFRGLIGGGDAKLIATASLWMGWAHLPSFLLLTALAGGVLALSWVVAKRMTSIALIPPWANRYFTAADGIPYGVAVAAASLMMFVSLDWTQTGLLVGAMSEAIR
jgi:prepilin peptidase CpaA